ncbi:phage baseplate assembly protein V [Cupriavidus basilensis]|uniref:phage baseplate assembly protein V n=1 Tax=Cupriavidus basilensis TaxID=68895 RepID=UPI0039F70DD7
MTRALYRLGAAIKQQAELQGMDVSKPRTGEIASYDPNKHAVKVILQPEGVEVAGWIPLGAVGIGNGFGVVCAPNLGDMVQVTFSEGNWRAPRVTGRFFSNTNAPPVVPAGDTWILHKAGQSMKFNGDGTIKVLSPVAITYQAQQHHFIGPVQMDGTLNVNQTISGEGGMQISGDNGTGNASTVTGNTNFVGQVSANGHRIDDSHKHVNSGGAGLGGVPQ